MSDRRLVLQALLRTNLSAFINKCFNTLEPGGRFLPNWHIDHIAWQLSRVRSGAVKRLIINVPPRHLKSICTSVAWPAWMLGYDPSLKFMAVSYAQDLANKHAGDFRQIVESDWYRDLFPDFHIRENRKKEIITSQNGGRFAKSFGGGITGQGADIILIDDPIKAEDALSRAERTRVNQLYDQTLYSRLNDRNTGAIVLIMQRLHEDDLTGHVLEQEDWEQAIIPAMENEPRHYRTGSNERDVHVRGSGDLIWPGHESQAALDQLRRTLGSAGFSAQYQQNPLPQAGQAVKREWLRFYDERPQQFDLLLASWDTASTLGEDSDYSVGTVWGTKENEFYLIDVLRGRFEVPDLKRHILDISLQYAVDATLVEKTDIGRAVCQEMRRTGPYRPLLCRPHLDKEARLLAQTPKFEAGQVLLPRHASWLDDYLHELLSFPGGRHDDQVDSTSQALKWLGEKLRTRHQPVTRRNPQRRQERVRPPGAA